MGKRNLKILTIGKMFLWTPEKIQEVTKVWFQQLGNKVEKISVLLLSAGIGSRLFLLLNWLKSTSLGGIPLLEYWLSMLHDCGIRDVYVNLHHHTQHVEKFLKREIFKKWVNLIYEEKLLGTAGTLLKAKELFKFDTILLIHADNWSIFSLNDFIKYHFYQKPKNCCMTMMTFDAEKPEQSGIVELDDNGIVKKFYEKKINPPSNNANAAVYLFDKDALQIFQNKTKISDFSTEVIPMFLGKIATWKNNNIHRDIGSLSSLKKAQYDIKPKTKWSADDSWKLNFKKNKIHEQIKKLKI